MRTYAIELKVRSKENEEQGESYTARAYAKGECPYQALFTVREYLLESSGWESLGEESFSITDESDLELLSIHLYLRKNRLFLEVDDQLQEQTELALSA